MRNDRTSLIYAKIGASKISINIYHMILHTPYSTHTPYKYRELSLSTHFKLIKIKTSMNKIVP